jgi:hypothetical protein
VVTISSMSVKTRNQRPKQRQVVPTLEGVIQVQAPENRQEEIWQYLRLFGYKPDRTIRRVHIAGYFGGDARTLGEVSQ